MFGGVSRAQRGNQRYRDTMRTDGSVEGLPTCVLSSQVRSAESDSEVSEVFRPAPDLVVVRVLGHLSESGAVAITDALEAEVGSAPFELFLDFTGLVNYDGTARRHGTSWIIRHQPQVERVWSCCSTKNVEMGLSVATMAATMAGITAEVVPPDVWRTRLDAALGDR